MLLESPVDGNLTCGRAVCRRLALEVSRVTGQVTARLSAS